MMKLQTKTAGFTLMELMIVVAIVAILAMIAYPSYTDSVRKSRRGDVQAWLLDIQLKQERWRANDTDYGTLAEIGMDSPPTSITNYYTITLPTLTATAFVIQAAATGSQTSDTQSGTDCSPMTLDQSGNQAPAVCWKR